MRLGLERRYCKCQGHSGSVWDMKLSITGAPSPHMADMFPFLAFQVCTGSHTLLDHNPALMQKGLPCPMFQRHCARRCLVVSKLRVMFFLQLVKIPTELNGISFKRDCVPDISTQRAIFKHQSLSKERKTSVLC